MNFSQKMPDIFIELRTDIDICFIKEWDCSTRFNLSCNLSSHPSISAGVTHEYQSGCSCIHPRIFIRVHLRLNFLLAD